MRKFFTAFFSIILLLITFALITPFFVGRYVDRLLPTYYNAMTRFATVKITKTQRHWFSEDVTLEVAPLICPGQTFEQQQHIIFGPFIFAPFNAGSGPHFALALLDSTAVNAPFTLVSQALIKINRSLSGFDHITNLNYQDATRSWLVPSITIHFSYDLSHSVAQAELSIPSLTVNMKEAANHLDLTANMVNLTSTAHLKISQGLWYGDEGLRVDAINLKNDKEALSVNALTVNDSLVKLGNTANLTVLLTAKSLVSDAVLYQPVAFNVQLRDMDVTTLENYVKSLAALSVQYDEAQFDKLNQQLYLALLQHGLTAEINQAQLGTPHGVLSMDLSFTTPAQNYADIMTALNQSNNKITITIPKPMAQYLLEKYFAQSQFAAALSQPTLGGAQTADLLLQQFVNLKFFKLSADSQFYSADISMKNGRIYVNNQSLQDTLDLLAPASSSKRAPSKSKLAITTQEMVEHYDS